MTLLDGLKTFPSFIHLSFFLLLQRLKNISSDKDVPVCSKRKNLTLRERCRQLIISKKMFPFINSLNKILINLYFNSPNSVELQLASFSFSITKKQNRLLTRNCLSSYGFRTSNYMAPLKFL